MLDVRSPLAMRIMNANPDGYRALVSRHGPSSENRQLLEGIDPKSLLSVPVKSLADALAVLAALWLWNDGLAEAHQIVQKSPAATIDSYAFWHAIMHRREGDFSNSKYWYARCENHPA